MSWLDRARKVAKKVTRPVARPLEKVLKPIARPLRPIASKAAGFVPGSLYLKAKVYGIKSNRGVEGYRRSQKVNRIGTAVVATAAGGYVLAPTIGAAATSLGGLIKGGALAIGAGVSSIFSRVKGAGQSLGVDDMAAVAELANPLLEGGGDPRSATLDNDPRTGGGGGWGGDLPPATTGSGFPAWGWAVLAGVGVLGVLLLAFRR